LVWADIILTAAHCAGRFNDQVLVSAERKNYPVGGAVYRKTLSQMVYHPYHRDGTYEYDFMMFRIEPVEGYESKLVQLNGDPGLPAEGEMLKVIGMGYLREGGPTSEVLNHVNVKTFSQTSCVAAYGSRILPQAMFCAGWPTGGYDSCDGDSGAPILNSLMQQVGLVSFGSGCARGDRPGVYARISAAKQWIDSTICSLSTMPPSWCPNYVAPQPAPVVAPAPAPVAVTTLSVSSSVSFRVEATYDRYPEQVRWSIRTKGKRVIGKNYDTRITMFSKVANQIPLVQGQTYTLLARDRVGDGFCCSHGAGKIEVYATVGGVDKLLASMRGDIGSYKKIKFTVPIF
jgi:trypsin